MATTWNGRAGNSGDTMEFRRVKIGLQKVDD